MKQISFIFIFLLCLCISSCSLAEDSDLFVQQDLFVSGVDGYHTYRIPSIITAADGSLLAFCEGRKIGKGDSGNIDLLMKRSADNGKTWSDAKVIWDDGVNTCGNPCPVVDRDTNKIWLLLTWNDGADREDQIKKETSKDTRRVYVLCSDDNGQNFSKPLEITNSVKPEHWKWYATGPCSGIQLQYGPKKGRLIIPADHSFLEVIPSKKYGAHVIYSDDHGATWHYSDAVFPGANENQVVEMLDGKLVMNARNHLYRGSRIIAISEDAGQSWPYVSFKSNLQEPRCQASFVRYSPNKFTDKNIILFSNPNHNKKRLNMTVKLSYDEGKTWPVEKCLYQGRSAYSCLTVLADGKIACFYEAGTESQYEKIVLAVFTLDWLTKNKNQR